MKIGRILDPTPDWEHADPDIRWQALQNRLPPADVLARLARGDTDARVRVKAARHLDDPQLLLSLCDDADPAVADAAGRRWVEACIDKGVDSHSLGKIDNERLLACIARFACDAELRLASVSRVSDANLLAAILESDNHASVHQACANRISEEEVLEQLLRRFRGKDKTVNRILRQKLDEIREARDQSLAFKERCVRLRESFQQLATGANRDQFERRFEVLDEEWQAMLASREPQVDESTCREIEAARKQCADSIATMVQHREHQDTVARKAVEELESLTNELNVSNEPLPALTQTLDGIRRKWPVGFGEDHELTRRYYALIAPLENLAAQYSQCRKLPGPDAAMSDLQSALEKISWPAGWREPALLTEATERLQALQDAREKNKARIEQESAQLADQLERLEQSITEGKLKPANKLHNNLRKKFDNASNQITRDHKEQFARLGQQLRELQDWQGYVTMPKRIELCEQMETLRDDAAIPPPEKAKSIKDLQQQWKGLGPSNHRQSQQLWTRFKEAADAAFEPCAEYFAAQRQVREQNFAERTRICDSLETLIDQTDWENVDWKGINEIYVRARREWREYEDIPHARRKKVQSRFSRLIKAMESKLSEEQARNHAIKESLVERVKSMLAQEDMALTMLIAETKNAQTEWKQVGVTDRKTDQRLWKAFRAQCDLVFERRDEDSQRQRDTAEASRSAARDVSNKLKHLVAGKDIDHAQLRELKSAFAAVAPESRGDDVAKEFNRQVRQAELVLKEQASASWAEMLDEIRRKANICVRLERGELTQEAAEAEWQSTVEVEAGILEKLEARRSAAGMQNAAATADNLKAAELLCVRMEILAELPSPPEAQPLRMQYQVDRLNRELSKGQKETRSPRQQVDDLLIEWYTLGTLPGDADELRARFERAEEKLGA